MVFIALLGVTALVASKLHDEGAEVDVPGATPVGPPDPEPAAAPAGAPPPPPSPRGIPPLVPPVPKPVPASAGAVAPIRNPAVLLTEKRRKEMQAEAERQAESHVEAKRGLELKQFKEAIGPTLDDVRAEKVWVIYQEYYSERARLLRKRLNEAMDEAEATGEAPEPPDREKIYAEVRARAYEKLEKILSTDELAAFRKWWEGSHPTRKQDGRPK
jgi:hypothetical protein